MRHVLLAAAFLVTAVTMADAQKPQIPARMAGTWSIAVRPHDRDTVLLTHHMLLAADTAEWKVMFPGREPIKMNVVAVEGDSVLVRFGPYSSALRPDIRVLSEGHLRLDGEKLIGSIVARYSVQTADSVRHLRLVGTMDHRAH